MSEIAQQKKIILYIDDEYNILLKSLNLFDEEYNYTIIANESVEEGIETLESYHSIIDAVILDLMFPKYQMQGKEGLNQIIAKYPYLPVFILTGAENTKELNLAKQCLDIGAVDYYHKSEFDIANFINEIRSTTDEYRANKSNLLAKSLTTMYDTELPYLLKTERYKEIESITGVFGFELLEIIKEEEATSEDFKYWHTQLLQIIALGYKNTNFKICYQNETHLRIFIFITIHNEHDFDLEHDYFDLLYNIYPFFSRQKFPYKFKPINSKFELEDLLQFESDSYSNLDVKMFKPKNKEYKISNNKIGFSTLKKNKNAINIPILFETDNYSMKSLIESLVTSFGSLFQISIDQIKLTKEEIDSLIFIKKELVLNNNEDNALYLNWINNILKTENHWIFSVLIQGLGLNAKNNILNTFFNKKATIIDYFYHNKILKDDYQDYLQEFKRFPYIASLEQITEIFKLPTNTINELNYFKEFSKKIDYLPDESFEKGILIGKKGKINILIEQNQFRKHTYIIGKTGTGKTSIINSMMLDRIKKGFGCALIDPHGDICDKIFENIPTNRRKDVIIFDPTDKKYQFSFNPLDFDKNYPEQKSFIFSELSKILNETYDMDRAGGPMFEQYFKNALFLVLDTVDGANLEHVINVFQDRQFLNACLKKCQDKKVNLFFKNAMETTGDQGFENFVPYISSKFNKFVDNLFLNPVLCSAKKSFDFRELIDNNKILLVKLNKGRIGNEGVNFIGRLLFNKIIMTSYTRIDQKEEDRKDFTLFIDEFHNFTSKDVITALAESRKYRLQLVLANQTFSQLDEKVTKNIIANVGTLISANISPFDADVVSEFLLPKFTKQDILDLDNYQFIVKTSFNNKNTKPFIFNSIAY